MTKSEQRRVSKAAGPAAWAKAHTPPRPSIVPRRRRRRNAADAEERFARAVYDLDRPMTPDDY